MQIQRSVLRTVTAILYLVSATKAVWSYCLLLRKGFWAFKITTLIRGNRGSQFGLQLRVQKVNPRKWVVLS